MEEPPTESLPGVKISVGQTSKQPMRIGILKTGEPPADMQAAVRSYPTLIRNALGIGYTYSEFDVTKGHLPSPGSAADAYIITGSSSSTYDPDSWIARFRDWLDEVDVVTPVVGICFGHQIMAQAYGGIVEKASQGSAVGLHEYKVSHREVWMDDENRFVLPASHHDQVTKPPPASRVIATSDFCPYAALSYNARRAVSFQAHPEFPLDVAAMMIDRWQKRGTIGSEQAERARLSMQRPDDRVRVIGWIRRFLEGTTAATRDLGK